jgi:hypothetical protein
LKVKKKQLMSESNPKTRNVEEDGLARELAASGASLSELASRLARAEADAKGQTEPAPSVNKITWPQVGRVTEPGRYMFIFGWLTITAEDLTVWKQYPNAAFTLVRAETAAVEAGEEVAEEYRLGTFELRENLSLNER